MSRRRGASAWIAAVTMAVALVAPDAVDPTSARCAHADAPPDPNVIAAFAGAPSSAPSLSRRVFPEDVVPGVLLVHRRAVRDDDSLPPPAPVPPVVGARFLRYSADGTEQWELPPSSHATSGAETLAVRAALAADIAVARDADIEVDTYRYAHEVKPNDERFSKQWSLQAMKLTKAWETTTGDPTLVVAVVDTGVVEHPDLRERIVPGYDFITDPKNSGDGHGRDPDPTDAGTEDERSSGFHGLHMMGIVGATTNNSIGIAGVDWRCRIQPVRVLGVQDHRGTDTDIADGIRWAAGLNVPGVPQNQTPAKVINLSFGGKSHSRLLQDAVLAATARGVVVVASAGNTAEKASTNVPGALEGVLDVGASDPDGSLAVYSNFGSRLDVIAPGGSTAIEGPSETETPGSILSTSFVRASRQPVFAFAAGTSQAAAHASGVAALVRAVVPAAAPEVVAAILRRATVSTKRGCGEGCTAGLLDASTAVAFAKKIALATCGGVGCGNKRVAPAPLRPEEGCTIAAHPGVPVKSTGSAMPRGLGLVLAAALVALAAGRPRARAKRLER